MIGRSPIIALVCSRFRQMLGHNGREIGFSLFLTIFCISIFSLKLSGGEFGACPDGMEFRQSKTLSNHNERLRVIFAELNGEPAFSRPGYCHDNVLELVKRIQQNDSIDLEKSKVLLFFRFSPDWYPNVISYAGKVSPYRQTPNLVMTNVKGEGVENALFHVVLEQEGMIYDPSYAEGTRGIPKHEYFTKMFLNKDAIDVANMMAPSPPLAERLREKLRRYLFQTPRQMLAELRVRSIPAIHYLDHYHANLASKQVGNPDALWLAAEKDYPSVSLRNFLAKRPSHKRVPLPKYEDWDRTVSFAAEHELKPYVSYKSGIKMFANPENLLLGELQQIPDAIGISAPFLSGPKKFNRTDRQLETLRAWLFPPSMISPEVVRDKIIVDMAAGGGLAVEELNLEGAFAFGVEAALSPRQRKRMLHDTSLANPNGALQVSLKKKRGSNVFIQAHVAETGITDNTVDIIYETYGVFEYLYFNSKNNAGLSSYFFQTVNEWRRILKRGGCIRISNIDRSQEAEFKSFFNQFPGLRFVRFEVANKENNPYLGAIEIERVE
jgi:hypothetical protein